jgi:hypothetical protein
MLKSLSNLGKNPNMLMKMDGQFKKNPKMVIKKLRQIKEKP